MSLKRSPIRDFGPVKVTGRSPSRIGLLGQTFAPWENQNTATPVAGTLYATRVKMEERAASAVRNVRFSKGVQGSGVTLFKTAVFDLAGTKLGESANIAATVNAGGSLVHDIPTGTFAVDEVDYWLAFLQVGGTALALSRSASLAVINSGLTGGNLIFATGGAALTDMPASIVPASLAAQNAAWWIGLS